VLLPGDKKKRVRAPYFYIGFREMNAAAEKRDKKRDAFVRCHHFVPVGEKGKGEG